jgi:hypothetical protein
MSGASAPPRSVTASAFFAIGISETGMRCSIDPVDRLSERRKSLVIHLDCLFYEVGPEVELASHSLCCTRLHDRCTETPEYMALLRGALAVPEAARRHQ